MANRHKSWTEEDIQFLKNNGDKLTPQELAGKLNKSLSNVYKYLKQYKLDKWRSNGEKWTDEEIQYLKDNYLNMSYVDIAIKLNRTESSISGKLLSLGLKKHKKNANWTDKEKQFLIDNINKLNYKEISKEIKRTVQSIRGKAHELGLVSNDFKGVKLKKEQVQFIIANADKMTDKHLAIKFDVSIEAISAVRKKHGIKKTGNEVSGMTYPEQFVQDALNELRIEYIYNKQIGEYRPDFKIKDLLALIEVQGDYYHCNPYLYPDGPENEVQIKHVLRDYYKKCFFLSKGYQILYLWEYDIVNKPKKVKEIIKQFISAVQEGNNLDDERAKSVNGEIPNTEVTQ